jgi:hypothetical protein
MKLAGHRGPANMVTAEETNGPAEFSHPNPNDLVGHLFHLGAGVAFDPHHRGTMALAMDAFDNQPGIISPAGDQAYRFLLFVHP